MVDAVKQAESIVLSKVSPEVLFKIKAMKADIAQAEVFLRGYVQCVADSMGLVGNFRMEETGELVRMPIVDPPKT
mgnify:CR=1 FL=1